MADEYDFFADLGETISRTAKDFSSRADSFFESQKIRTKIVSEQRMIDKAMADIGNIIYKKYIDGEAVDEGITDICEDITQRKVAIARYREKIARMSGQKICAACGAAVPASAAFCMQCGAPCEMEEPEETKEEPEQAPEGDIKVPDPEEGENIRRESEEAEAESILEGTEA